MPPAVFLGFMIDFHTHIMPGIDDGSIDIDMTESMLEAELSQGVSHIYATPHFYADRASVEKFLERRACALAETERLTASRHDLPRITAGAEVLFFTGMGRAEQLSQLCIAGTDLLLLEMPFGQWTPDMVREVREVMDRQALRIILAHVERYEQFQRDMSAYDEILSMPLTVQINAGSFIAPGLRGRRRLNLALSLMDLHDECIIGSDCHNMTDRRPNLREARAVIERRAGADRLARLDEYTERLLSK